MSEENVEVFKRNVEAWNHDDFDAWIDLRDPACEWFALMEVYRGPAGARQGWESFKADMRITGRFDDIRDLGDSVLALGEMEATGHATGLKFTREVAELVTYRDGKAIRVRDFATHAEALEAAGLREQAMSQENVEIIRTAFDDFNSRDWESWEALHHADMVVIPMKDWPDWPDAERVDGIEAWLERVLLLLEPWREQRLEIDAMRTTGDLVVVSLRWVATGRESEIEVDMRLAGVYTIIDGKIARIEFFRDPNEALEAAGLRD